MRAIDAADRLAQLLRARGVALTPTAHGLGGPGEAAMVAWASFCELALEAADEPFERHGAAMAVCDDSDCDLLLHESGTSGADDDRYVLHLTRQFTFTAGGEYAGMNGLTLTIECDGLPEGRVPKAQRWGYAGRRRPGVDDAQHPEMGAWAGHVPSWQAAVETSNSFRALEALPPARFEVVQSDI